MTYTPATLPPTKAVRAVLDSLRRVAPEGPIGDSERAMARFLGELLGACFVRDAEMEMRAKEARPAKGGVQ